MSLFVNSSPREKQNEMYVPEYIEKCNKILKWASFKPKFSCSFVDSVLEQLKTYESITDKQKEAVDRIIKNFKI